MNSNFEIRRNRLTGTISGTLPATAMPVGTALMISAKDADTGVNTFALASGRVDGFVTKEVRVGVGLTATELAYGLNTYPSGEFSTPYTAGNPGSIEPAEAIEIEGSDYIIGSGTGAITNATAAETEISFYSGKARVAQTNDYVQFRLAKQMTPVNGGNCRLYLEAVQTYIKA